jgi:hypothetical protein
MATLGVAVMDYFNLLGRRKIIEVQAHYMQYTCGKNNIDMRVTKVSDKEFGYLQGKVISPELLRLNQDVLTGLVYQKTSAFRDGQSPTLSDFTLVGYIRENEQDHCSGAICFKVKGIKYAGDSTFTKF